MFHESAKIEPFHRSMDLESAGVYKMIRGRKGAGYYQRDRGLIAVWGNESVQFLDGLLTNDMKPLGDGQQMLAAFPNPQGRLLAVARIKRAGDRFLIDTEADTSEKLYKNLFRFSFAGDFFVEDLSGNYRYFEFFGDRPAISDGEIEFDNAGTSSTFVPTEKAERFSREILNMSTPISENLYEILRIENGIPIYGVDMDETTIVPELGIEDMISYTKGCYIGQEIIARIHFRGHVAKQFSGLVLSDGLAPDINPSEIELITMDGKKAGRITSTAFSPILSKWIALAYIRYENLAAGTLLRAGTTGAVVTNLPFISRDIIES
jgi:tRNA-modifying protein YgfZ